MSRRVWESEEPGAERIRQQQEQILCGNGRPEEQVQEQMWIPSGHDKQGRVESFGVCFRGVLGGM